MCLTVPLEGSGRSYVPRSVAGAAWKPAVALWPQELGSGRSNDERLLSSRRQAEVLVAPEKNPAVARISALPVAPPKRALVHQKSALLAQLSGVEALVEQATAAAPVGSLGARAAGEPSEPPPLVQALAQALTALRPEAREDALWVACLLLGAVVVLLLEGVGAWLCSGGALSSLCLVGAGLTGSSFVLVKARKD